MKQISKNIFVESETSVCNSSAVVTKDGVVIIDTPMAPASAKKWAAEAAKHGPIKYVINTEPHGDHISGDCYFGGTLVTHAGTRDAILESKVEDFRTMLKTMQGVDLDSDFRFRLPDITLTDKLTLYLGGATFNLMHMPGHTPFQVVVYVPEERAVFTSDNISRVLPFFHQAVPDAWLKTLKEMEKLDVDYVIPGHGPVGDKSLFREMYNNVTTWLETVKEAIAKGMTLEEVQQKVTMLDKFPSFPKDERTAAVVKMNVTRLYEILKK